MPTNLGINGFGRIGRLATRLAVERPERFALKAINASGSLEFLKYNLLHDSVHGWAHCRHAIEVDSDHPSAFLIHGKRVVVTNFRDPALTEWGEHGEDMHVLEMTGAFLTQEAARPHIDNGGAKKVVMSAPAKDLPHTQMYVMGVNHEEYSANSHEIISCASCTTNGLAPLVKAVHDKFGIDEGLMTTIHAVTGSQTTLDSTREGQKTERSVQAAGKQKWRTGRCALNNIIPASTGAAKAVGYVIPELQGKLTGMSFRIPTPNVSVVDLTVRLSSDATYDQVCEELKHRASTDLAGILGYEDDPLVSQDFVGDIRSSIFDATAGLSLEDSRLIKLVAWYDNEMGYSMRMLDLAEYVAKTDRLGDQGGAAGHAGSKTAN